MREKPRGGEDTENYITKQHTPVHTILNYETPTHNGNNIVDAVVVAAAALAVVVVVVFVIVISTHTVINSLKCLLALFNVSF